MKDPVQDTPQSSIEAHSFVVHQCRPERKSEQNFFLAVPHNPQTLDTRVGTSKPDFGSVDICKLLSIISIFLEFSEHRDFIFCSHNGKRSDVQPELMLSFYPMSIS